jgi:alkanesulfonate monooxygenase SsuD/methylene tetrahydromethanopterin reductase-like flavin-dependent oxidoreductase (luciferase family)
MKIGIGLPNTIPGTEGRTILEWARRAEERGFSGVATIDRIAYPSYESLIALAAVGAATERLELVTNVLLGPTRNPVLLAKEAASVDQISGGRLTLGVGVGSREDDFTLAGTEFRTRGKRWDADLELIHRVWAGERVGGSDNPVGPPPVRGTIPVLIGGMSDKAVERMARWGVGWTVGGAPPEASGPFVPRVRRAWEQAGREGEPRLVCLSYFGIGEEAEERGRKNLTDYYGDYGPGIAARMPKTPEAFREVLKAFGDAGFGEIFFDPTTADLDQVDLLADAVL